MDLRQWVATWQRAGDELRALRNDELKTIRTPDAVESLARAFQWAFDMLPPRASSGLVEQQAVFSRLRHP